MLAEDLIHLKKIADHIKKKGGYARMSKLRSTEFQITDIAKLCVKGSLEKVKRGYTNLAVVM